MATTDLASRSLTAIPAALSPKRLWTIVGLLSASIAINLVDRQTLSVLAPLLRDSMHWSNTQYAYVAVAFNLGMMGGQVPAGAFLDRVGARRGLAIIFVAWSAITAAHALGGPGTGLETIARGILSVVPGMAGLGAGLAGFILLRFFLGLAQCGNYTAGIKALAGLFPAATRSKAGGLFNAGAQFGSVVAPPLIITLLVGILGMSWRAAFVVPAALGLLWLIPWLAAFPDRRPAPGTASVAGSPAPDIGIGRLMRQRKVLGLFLIRVFSGPITTFYWTWLPFYLRNGRGMSYLALGLFAALPNLFGMAGNIVGGLATDRLIATTGSIDRGRKIGFACAFGLGALSMAMPFVGNDYLAIALMGLAVFGNQWYAATYIGAVGDVVPQELAGRVNGIAGFGDNGAALLAVLFTGAIVDRYSWTPVFVGAGVFPILALLSLLFVLGRIEPARFTR